MKIVDIRTTPLSYRCDPPYGSAGGMQARRGGLLVEIETDERVIGIGEAGVGGGVTRDVIDKLLQPMLIGEDPLLIEGLWQKMWARTRQYGRRGLVMHAISGIDIALWDIAGKVAKLIASFQPRLRISICTSSGPKYFRLTASPIGVRSGLSVFGIGTGE